MLLDRTDVVNRRFRRWLRAHWWLPAAGAIVAGAAAGLLLRGTGYETSVTFSPVADSPVLRASGLPGDTFATAVPIAADAVSLSRKSVLQGASAAAGENVDVFVQFVKETENVDVTISGPTRESVAAARDFYVDDFLKVRGARYSKAAGAFIASLTALRGLQTTRLDELAGQTAGLPPDSPGEVEAALIDERADVLRESRETLTRIDAAASLPSRQEEIGVVTAAEDITPRSGRAITAAALALFIALCVLVYGYLKAILSTRLTSAEDVGFAAGSANLSIIEYRPQAGPLRVASILGGLGRSRTTSGVLLLPIDATTDAAGLADDLARATTDPDASVAIVGAGHLDSDGLALTTANTVVLVATAGQSRNTDLVRVLHDMAVAGVEPAALILVR